MNQPQVEIDMASHSQTDEPATTAAATTRPLPKLFTVVYRPGRAWIEGKPIQEQPLQSHLAYMKQLQTEGRLFAAGPMPSMNGGMAILQGASSTEAAEIVEQDPAVISGVFEAELHAWIPMVYSETPLLPVR